MILIADSGSTKCDWALCSKEGSIINKTQTIGLNPNFVTQEDILKTLKNSDISPKIDQVFFYGAGCSSKLNKEKLKTAFALFFKNTIITIYHDLEAAAFALYKRKPCIIAILGTGSNSCYFDGVEITENSPSLGFILGDEGSGNYFGKRLLRSYFNNKLPEPIKKQFELTYKLNFEEYIERIYHQKRPNVFLADFFKFIYKHKKNSYINKMLIKGIDVFFKKHIICYEDYQKHQINFIGSVAYFLSNHIHATAKKYNCNINKIIKSPINDLINYHFKLTQ